MTLISKSSILSRILLIPAVFTFFLLYAFGMPVDRGQENTQGEEPKVLRATEEQADLIRACVIAANRAGSDAGTLGKSAGDRHFENFADFLMSNMEKQLDTFKSEHKNFCGSLTEDQKERITADREAVDKRVEAVDSDLEQLHEQMKKSALDKETISKHALAIESMMKECRQLYKNIAAMMRVKLERGR